MTKGHPQNTGVNDYEKCVFSFCFYGSFCHELFFVWQSQECSSSGANGRGQYACCPPTDFVVSLIRLNDFPLAKAEATACELNKRLGAICFAQTYVEDTVRQIPTSCIYKPRNRYWAGKILDMLKVNDTNWVRIGLTDRDISTSVHGHYNYGIMGLSLRPGSACVVSTFRLKRSKDLWKVVAHEFLHSRGLPRCRKDNPKCIMQDAHGKDTYYMKNDLCGDCRKHLQEILGYDPTMGGHH